MANKHIISCSVTGLKCVCDTVSIPADNAGSILIKAKFTPEWDGLIISLAYRKVWGDSETTGEALFDGGELDAKDLFLCSDYGNEEAIPASYVEFGFIGRSSGDTEGFIKASSVCSVKLADSAYISNPGVTADSLSFSSRLLKAENEANISFEQLIEHKSDKNNPHGATAAQVGAYTKAETDDLLSDKADALELAKVKFDILGLPTFKDVYTKDETDCLLKGKADSNSVYTRKQTDALLSKTYYYKDVKLTDVVSVEGVGTVKDNVLSTTSGKSVFKFNITGKVKFSCIDANNTFSLDDLRLATTINVDGQTVDFISSMLEQTYTFDVNKSLEIVAERCDIVFSEFSIGVYVKDSITGLENGLGDIDTALDAILAIQESIIGGVEQ